MAYEAHRDSFHTLTQLATDAGTYRCFSLPALAAQHDLTLDHLPVSIRIALESLLRNENGRDITTKTRTSPDTTRSCQNTTQYRL